MLKLCSKIFGTLDQNIGIQLLGAPQCLDIQTGKAKGTRPRNTCSPQKELK